jgi:tetratricopeptide (TPR) repeat protein
MPSRVPAKVGRICYVRAMSTIHSPRYHRLLILVIATLVIATALSCNRGAEQSDEPPASGADATSGSTPGRMELPAGHPPIGGQIDPSDLPLKENGSGSLAELERGRTATREEEASDSFVRGFHLTFTVDQASRDYPAARDLFKRAIALDPEYAEAYRGLAYAEFNIGFNRDAAMENYLKAIDLKPDYGEVHYALAFMYAMDDLEKGSVHLEKALELGVEDERKLVERFYGGSESPLGSR